MAALAFVVPDGRAFVGALLVPALLGAFAMTGVRELVRTTVALREARATVALLAAAVRTVLTGERVIDPALAAVALTDGAHPLTDREREVLRAAADGSTNAELARTLHPSQGTVRNYLSTAIQELAVRNRAEAARVAREKGWL
ncbi:hypothetical protein SHIRM173S_02846 [Streptomyces hirsutus]